MKFEAEVRATFPSAREAEIAAKSLGRELGFRGKSRGSADARGSMLVVRMMADDLASLRAGMNSALRLLQVAGASMDVAESD